MKVNLLKILGTWRDVANSANTTINKEEGIKEPSSSWIRRMLLCEHSPIRQIQVKWKWKELPYWVSVHFVRHKIGCEHWVRTSRTDRTGINRIDLSQGSLVEHEMMANPQSIINISRKRLCSCASTETREAWKTFLESIKNDMPELYEVCVPECVYRGHCYEYKSCNYHKTEDYKNKLEKYREGINK